MFAEQLQKVTEGRDLSLEEMAEAIGLMMQGECPAQEIGPLLLALREKGESVSEIAGAARAMRQHMTPIRSERTDLLDTCGTGGDGAGLFNISTAAAIVAAAAGAPVAKHGNRSITSKTGSADVLAELGVNIGASIQQVERCLAELGICFCFAPQLHPAMKNVAAVRRELGVPTIFNLLGPLSNPAAAPFQVLGVGKPHLRKPLAAALQLLGVRRAAVVCGQDGMDEVTITTTTDVSLVEGGEVREFQWAPKDFGLPLGDTASMEVETPRESAALIRDILDGQDGASRDIVILNAAAGLWVAGKAGKPQACATLAAAAIDDGRAIRLLERLAELSSQDM
jgi:anthranilate phosphoribosyltransferase